MSKDYKKHNKLDLKTHTIIFANEYILKERIGGGSFGQIYLALHKPTSELVAIKLESRLARKTSTLSREAKMLSELNDEAGFPKLHFLFRDEEFNAIVLNLLGPNLEKLFKSCSYRFSLKTTLMIADQLLTRLETIHKKSIIHRDTKPENFVIGLGKSSKNIHVIDFGLAKYYLSKNGKHIPRITGKGLVGTARYCSINTHKGIEQARRDDIESIGYILVYFMKGRLPWQGIKNVKTKDEKYEKIKQMKISIPLLQLCKEIPQEFVDFLKYIRNLEFKAAPDYKYLKKLVRKLHVTKGYNFDYAYDWKMQKRQKRSKHGRQKQTKEQIQKEKDKLRQKKFELDDLMVKINRSLRRKEEKKLKKLKMLEKKKHQVVSAFITTDPNKGGQGTGPPPEKVEEEGTKAEAGQQEKFQ